jgi:hypothetical protein
MEDEREFAHFEYLVGPAERAAFANGCASRNGEIELLSRQLAEAQAELNMWRASFPGSAEAVRRDAMETEK